MATIKLAIAGIALIAGAQTATAKERTADLDTVVTGRDWRTNHDLGQRYCIVDPSMRSPQLTRVCRSLAEWQVNRIDPRTMPRL